MLSANLLVPRWSPTRLVVPDDGTRTFLQALEGLVFCPMQLENFKTVWLPCLVPMKSFSFLVPGGWRTECVLHGLVFQASLGCWRAGSMLSKFVTGSNSSFLSQWDNFKLCCPPCLVLITSLSFPALEKGSSGRPRKSL